MAVVTLFCRITGYLRDKALFSVIGAGHLYDMYRTANRIPNAFRGLFAEGTLHAAFVPTLAQLTGKTIEWDAENMTVKGQPELDVLLKEPAMKGWQYGEKL